VLYLNRWTFDFNPEITSLGQLQSRSLPHLLLVFLDDPIFPHICNSKRKFLGIATPKSCRYFCVIIYMEVDLSKELQEEIELNLKGWCYIRG